MYDTLKYGTVLTLSSAMCGKALKRHQGELEALIANIVGEQRRLAYE